MGRGLAFGVVIAVFVIALVVALDYRYGFMGVVQLAPTVKTGAGSLPGTGSGGTLQGDCCVCIADTDLGSSMGDCAEWLGQQTNCGVKKQVTLKSSSDTCWQDAECGTDFLPNECKDKTLRIRYEGHSSSNLCNPMIDYAVNVCIKAGATCGEIVDTGCATFQNYIAALLYLSSKQSEHPNLKLTVTANQCISYGGNICKTSASACTISVDASAAFCSFDTCNFGETCARGAGGLCGSATCTDSNGDLTQKVCCDKGGNAGKWTREEDCPSCNETGVCCTGSGGVNPSCSEKSKAQCYFYSDYYVSQFHANKSCSSFQCPKIGACCSIDKEYGYSSCRMTFAEFCTSYNETRTEVVFHAGQDCAEVNNCQGACCIKESWGSQYCEERGSAIACKSYGGSTTFTSGKGCGQIDTCAPVNISCCVLYNDGSTGCLDGLNWNQCNALKGNGSIKNANPSYSSCSSRVCADSFGACCKINQFGIYSCTQSTLSQCIHGADPKDTVAWTKGKTCSQVNCKETLMYGSCCTFLANGSHECYEHLTQKQCTDLKNQSSSEKDIISSAWNANLTCASSYCLPPKGACCKIDVCGNGANSCQDDLTYQQCQEKKTACYNVQWSEGKKCSEIFCDKLGCRLSNSGAYTGPSCYQCKRNMGCSVYDLLNGGCPSWCSSAPDEYGQYCCGPQ